MSNILQEFEARCRDAIRGATFFGQPVKDMDAESLLMFAGYLASENTKLRKAAEKAEVEKAHDWLRSLSPPRWIPVEERMPEQGVRVLVYDADFRQCEIGDYYAHGGWAGSETLRPTHWMPLPPPPTKETV